MNIWAVIFDHDGTLVDSFGVKCEHHIAVAWQCYGIKLTIEKIREHWGLPFDTLISILYENSDSIENMRAANASLAHRYHKPEIHGAKETIKGLLGQGRSVGVVTATIRSHIISDLTRLDFPIDEISFIQAADDTEFHKPNPLVFDPSISYFSQRGIIKNQILYIGDDLTDYFAARDAGIHFLGVPTGFYSRNDFLYAGAQSIPSIRDLLKIIS